MSRFVWIKKQGLFRLCALSIYDLCRCKRIKEDVSAVLCAHDPDNPHTEEMAEIFSFFYLALHPVFARRPTSPLSLAQRISTDQLDQISKRYQTLFLQGDSAADPWDYNETFDRAKEAVR